MKITQLTPAQEARLPAYRDKWLAIGLDCRPLNFRWARHFARIAYQEGELDPPKVWLHFQSPLSCAIGQMLLQEVDLTPQELYVEVKACLPDHLAGRGSDSVKSRIRACIGDQLGGCHDAYWLAFYDFLGMCGADVHRLRGLFGLARHCGWWAPYEHACFLQDRHSEVHLADGVLHRDGGPAILYRDGFAVYALHGVRVPGWLALEASGGIDPRRIIEIDNAEVRREFVRKVGLDRIRHKLHSRLLDSKTVPLNTPRQQGWPCEYRLEELRLGEGKVRHVLVMPNASMPEITHVEYVPEECQSVDEAINFRLGRSETEVDEERGSDYFVHGDVILTPRGAGNLSKRWPTLIA